MSMRKTAKSAEEAAAIYNSVGKPEIDWALKRAAEEDHSTYALFKAIAIMTRIAVETLEAEGFTKEQAIQIFLSDRWNNAAEKT